jgi:hypothetical protein
MSVYVVNVDEGNNEGVCDDVLDMEKIVTCGEINRSGTGCIHQQNCPEKILV